MLPLSGRDSDLLCDHAWRARAHKLVRGMLRYSVLLAKVMSQANEHDTPRAQVRRGPGNGAADLGEPSRAAPASRAHRAWADRARSLRNPAGRPGRAGAARRDDSGGAGRAREGSAALHDARHFRARGIAARAARAARVRPAAGSAHGDRRGPGTGEPGPAPAGRVAGEAAEGTHPRRASDAAGGRAHPEKAQPVLSEAAPVLAAAEAAHSPQATPPAQSAGAPQGTGSSQETGSPRKTGSRPGGASRFGWPQTFRSLSTRNYRLFAAGQVVSNTGTWMQRVAQDWLV